MEVGSCEALGGPVFSATTGRARAISTPPITPAANFGRASAALTTVIRRVPLLREPICQRLTLGPSR